MCVSGEGRERGKECVHEREGEKDMLCDVHVQ